MEGNEEGDDWGDMDPGDSVWEQEATIQSMGPPSSQQAPATSGSSGWGLAAGFQRWRENKE